MVNAGMPSNGAYVCRMGLFAGAAADGRPAPHGSKWRLV